MKMNHKLFYIALVFLLVMLTLLHQTGEAYAQQAGMEFLAGVPADFPPHYSIDYKTGKPVGFAIDVMDEVARRSGIKVRYVVYPTWSKTLEAMEKGEVLLIPNLGIIAEREVQMNFTSSVETYDIVIFVRKTTTDIKGIEDLDGKEVAVVEENKGLFLMQERGGSKLQIYASQDEAFLSLISGKSDALVYPEPPIKLLLQQTGLADHIKIVGKPLLEIKRGIAVRKGNRELLKKLDDEVKTFIKTPRYEKIYAKWYGKPEPYWTARRVTVFGGGLLAFAIVILVVWRYLSLLRLNKELQAALTERKKAEKELRESEERYRILYDNVPTMNFTLDTSGNVVSLNQFAVRELGYQPEELIGRPMLDIFYDEDKPALLKQFGEVLQNPGRAYEWEFRKVHKDGRIVWVREIACTAKDQKGDIVVLVACQDISERRKLEGQLRQSQKMEAIGQLASGIAHDFNNILTAIIGYASLTQMKLKEDDPLRHNIDQILASSERAAHLTQSLLAFSRKHINNPAPVNLNELIKKVEKFLRRVISEDIELKVILNLPVNDNAPQPPDEITPPPSAPPLKLRGGRGSYVSEGEGELTVMADHGQIEQVMMNLATNARDAMPKGGYLTIETGTMEIDEGYIKAHGYGKTGRYALLSVTDSGIGMDEKTREKIFEPFFTTKEVGKGTGLGLSIVYGIVKQHAGYVNCYSEPGKGTTFRIYLPLIKTEEVKEIKPAEPEKPVTGTETILLAEDEENVRELTRIVLEEYGYKVIEAIDGEDAVNKFMENKYRIDLLLFDLIMPKMSGKEAFDRIRKIMPDIKVLFASGYPADFIHREEITEQGLSFVSKPISPTALIKKVREALDK